MRGKQDLCQGGFPGRICAIRRFPGRTCVLWGGPWQDLCHEEVPWQDLCAMGCSLAGPVCHGEFPGRTCARGGSRWRILGQNTMNVNTHSSNTQSRAGSPCFLPAAWLRGCEPWLWQPQGALGMWVPGGSAGLMVGLAVPEALSQAEALSCLSGPAQELRAGASREHCSTAQAAKEQRETRAPALKERC